MEKQDYKNALINFNNAQLLKEKEVKLYIRRYQCFNQIGGAEKKAVEELENIRQEIKAKDIKYVGVIMQGAKEGAKLKLREIRDKIRGMQEVDREVVEYLDKFLL